MGISEADLAFIAALGPMPKRVCDLVDQDLHCNNDAVFDGLGLNAPRRGKSGDFWKAIGSDYLALDVVGDATRFDLNTDSVPADWKRFDLVTNCGDTEHIIHQVNCFTVMHDLTAVGGVLYHALPICGYVCHGFFRYDLRFFDALATANGYEVLAVHIDIAEHGYYGPLASPLLNEWSEKLPFPDASVRVAFRKRKARAFQLPIDLPAAPKRLHQRAIAKFSRMVGISFGNAQS